MPCGSAYSLIIDDDNYNYFVKIEFSSLVYNEIKLNPIFCANKNS